jgi:predicted nucleic acid-binding protein
MVDYTMRVSEVTDPKDSPRKLTEAEIDRLSTPEERFACARYKALQHRCRETGSMGETDLLIASEAIGILVARNKRLGLIK